MANYKNIIKQIAEYKQIPLSQSYLVCSEDSLLSELFVRYYIEDLTGKYNSADIIELPEKEKITVADIDYLTTAALVSPLELPYKFYILKNSDSMQDAAANKLLKTLEEPPPSIKIFVLCSDERIVLPTIRSRCAIINLSPLSDEAIIQALELLQSSIPITQRPSTASYTLAKEASLGSLSRAEQILKGEYNDVFDICFEMLLYMKSSTQILSYSSKFAQKAIGERNASQLGKLIWTTSFILHETLKYGLRLELSLKSRHYDISQVAQNYSPDAIIRLKPIIERAQKRLASYGNVQSIIDEFLFSILEVRQKCNK